MFPCVCTRVYTMDGNVRVCMCVCMYVCVWSLRLSLDVFLGCLTHYLLQQGLSLSPELDNLATLAVQLAPGSLCFCLLRAVITDILPCLPGMYVGHLNSSLHADMASALAIEPSPQPETHGLQTSVPTFYLETACASYREPGL